MTMIPIDPTITPAVIDEAVQQYRLKGRDDEDWWYSVPADGYKHGVDVNIYFDPDEGISTRRALVYPNAIVILPSGFKLWTDTSRLLARIPESDWLS